MAASTQNKWLMERAMAEVNAKAKKVCLMSDQPKHDGEWLAELMHAFSEHREILEQARQKTETFRHLIKMEKESTFAQKRRLPLEGEHSISSWLDILADTFPMACVDDAQNSVAKQENEDMWRILRQQHELENTPENIGMVLAVLRGHGRVSFRFLHGNGTVSHTTIVVLAGKRFLVWRSYGGACVISAANWAEEFEAIRREPSGGNDLGLTQADADAMLPFLQRVVEEVLPAVTSEQETASMTEKELVFIHGRIQSVFIFTDTVFHFEMGYWARQENACIAITGAAGWTMPDSSPLLASYDNAYIAEKLAMHRLGITKEEIDMHLRSLKAL